MGPERVHLLVKGGDYMKSCFLFGHRDSPYDNVGETKLVAVAAEFRDEGMIRKVDEPNPDYILVEKGAVLNWWDIIEVAGHASLNTKAEKIIASVGAEKLAELMRPLIGEGAIPSIIAMLGTMTVLRQINLITGASNIPVTKEQLMDLNAQLNQIAI